MANNPKPCGGKYSTMQNYGGCTLTSTAGYYDPNCCDFQYELVRTRHAPFNPWYPVQALTEKRSSHFPVDDPWAAEQAAMKRVEPPPPKIVEQIPHTRGGGPYCSGCGHQHNRCVCAGRAPYRPAAASEFVSAPCSTCPKKGCDCGGDCNEYEYCFSPACSTSRPCRNTGTPACQVPMKNRYKIITPPI